ncbi:hypothetical protein CRUP_029343 [Coryphaenoides rupestris]|nr:hypothetical protein CRUP_029343 [Coryphaenoides rupestris]
MEAQAPEAAVGEGPAAGHHGGLICASFNQDATSLSMGTKMGYRLLTVTSVDKMDSIHEGAVSQTVCWWTGVLVYWCSVILVFWAYWVYRTFMRRGVDRLTTTTRLLENSRSTMYTGVPDRVLVDRCLGVLV